MRISTVASVTGLGVAYAKNLSLKNKIQKVFLNHCYSFAFKGNNTMVLFENTHDRDLLTTKTSLYREHSTVVHGAGVDISIFKPSPEPESEIIHVLFAARLIKNKGLFKLISAIRIIKESHPSVELNVAGITDIDANHAIPVNKLKELNANNEINWLGDVSDMPSLIASSHIICLPSMYGEGIPRILIEANACKRPVITTNVPGCNEFITNGENGLVVEPGDVQQLTKALLTLIQDKSLREKLGSNGRRKVADNYSNEKVNEEMFSAYKSVMHSS